MSRHDRHLFAAALRRVDDRREVHHNGVTRGRDAEVTTKSGHAPRRPEPVQGRAPSDRAERVTWVQIVRIPLAGVEQFNRYEALVLPLLPDHGGRLEARYASSDGTVEVHVVTFGSAEALAAYLADDRRNAVLELLHASGTSAELLPVTER